MWGQGMLPYIGWYRTAAYYKLQYTADSCSQAADEVSEDAIVGTINKLSQPLHCILRIILNANNHLSMQYGGYGRGETRGFMDVQCMTTTVAVGSVRAEGAGLKMQRCCDWSLSNKEAQPSHVTRSSASTSTINMATTRKAHSLFAVLWFVFIALIPTVEAFDGGDAVALLLGMTITVVGFCACLGCHAGDHNILQNVSPLATFLKLTSLGFIIGVGVVGNLLISILLVKDKSLHRAPYYFLLDLCASDILRSAICFPFVFTSVKNGSAWTYGTLTCKVIAFLGVLSCFHTAFMLFCISVTRYLAIAHHRFYTKRLTFWTCLAVICMVWTLSVAMAFPPVLDVGTYSFIREEDQCTFQHRSFRANDSLGFMLLLALILLATQLVYLKLIFFVHDRRKMKPVQFVPAVSQNWTFHGPGASGQAAANWLAGFGRGPTPPTLLGIRQNSNAAGRRRLLVLDEFKTEKRISRMFYIMTFFFLSLWGPYLVACYWRVFARGPVVPGGYLTAAVWMSFAQAGVNPFICIFSNRELRRCFSTTLLYCRKSRQVWISRGYVIPFTQVHHC
ncbi:hypothetical protein NFI96_000473 [Prochilodus magdalenae]|nr:hypothetical protein NFI96_000473 [Prochilodus magdalenae]